MRFSQLSETKLKNQVIEFLRRNYPAAWFYKSADRWTSGIPDLILCQEGRFYAVELKAGSNKPTRIQEFVMRKIREAGGRASVCRNVEDVKRFIEEGGEGDD